MKRNITAISTVAALLLGSGVVLAQEALDGEIELDPATDGYADSQGIAVKTGLGECLKTGSWSEDSLNEPCEGIEPVAEVVPVPEPEPVPAPEPTPPEPIVTTATLGAEALFNFDSAELVPAGEQAMADLLTQLDSYQEISAIDVVGHTDSRGSEEYNQGLSEERAQTVSDFLMSAYPTINISSSGMGETSPVATNSTPEGRQLNRRVEVQVTAKSIEDPQS